MTQEQTKTRILLVDDDKAFRLATQTLLEDEGMSVVAAKNVDEALVIIEQQSFDLILSDLVMGAMSGIAFLQELNKRNVDTPVIMVTGFGSIATAVEAMRLGAVDYLTKPCNNEELVLKVRKVLQIRKNEEELVRLRTELKSRYSLGSMVSCSPRMKEIFEKIKRVAETDVTVLVQGESGTGKELVARALHFTSAKSEKPFIAVNCAAIPEHLLESELFGHEKGAFTGAIRQRAGKFEEADGGTLFLDEIGDLSPSTQSKLLRVLQEKSFNRVGGKSEISVNTRIVAATNRNLDIMMHNGDFREDLYYRLSVFPIQLPPLRERLEDIPLLTEALLKRHVGLSQGVVKDAKPNVITEMMNYSWPGNIRELENLLKRAIINSDGTTISSIDIPRQDSGADEPVASGAADPNVAFKDYLGTILRSAEKKYLLRMLENHKGNINQIAKLMEVDRKTVYRKLSDHAIDPAQYRD